MVTGALVVGDDVDGALVTGDWVVGAVVIGAAAGTTKEYLRDPELLWQRNRTHTMM
jgi:hypothetical protein